MMMTVQGLDRRLPIDKLLEASVKLKVLAILGVLAGPVALALFLVVLPAWHELKEARSRLNTADRERDSARALAFNYDEVARTKPIRDRFVARFDAWVPPTERLPEVLAAVTHAAAGNGVADLTFARESFTKAVLDKVAHAAAGTPAPTPAPAAQTAGGIKETAVRLEARADLRAAGIFLSTLASAPRMLRIDELKLSPLQPEKLARISPSDRARLALSLRLTAFRVERGAK